MGESVALLDGDLLVYKIGFTTEDVTVEIACTRMDGLIGYILRAVEAESYHCFLTSTDKSNFRYGLYPEYKSGRSAPRPKWYGELRAYLGDRHSAETIVGYEADDAIADAVVSRRENASSKGRSVVCSIDKDLNQVPGPHFNWTKEHYYDISEDEAYWWFYYQLLRGDPTDSVPGVKGIGDKIAKRYLDGLDPSDYFNTVREVYNDVYLDRGDELMLLYGRLLKLGRELWAPEKLVNTVPASKQSSAEPLSDGDSSTNP